ncbi:MAG: 3-hydroxyacyl-CoA dehydrogenase NAD-binding domain-containing protein, partial [Gemmatimonadota bacterium]|nr:3-hydroxyacyl-CoA dehydrogenase NAD-binding domain-containing protein [Gemmatimonadota bacterium]
MADIQKVGVVGCGLMGRGIAQVCAAAGYETVVREIAQEPLDKGLTAIEKSLAKSVEREKMTSEARDATLENLRGTTDLAELFDADIVIEAIVEDIEAKNDLFGKLDEGCPEHTILASNTSSLTVTEMAAATDRPDRFVGLHFFNPVPVMKLVEVVRQGA